MHFHSNEKIKHQTPQTFLKNHNGKNVSAHSNATTLTKLPEPTMTLKILEAKINHSSMKSTEMNLYCKVIYGCQEWNTNVETVMNYNPKWQEV